MRYLIIFISLILIFSQTFLTVSAQQAPNNPLDEPTPAAAPSVNIIGDSLTLRSLSYIRSVLANASIDPPPVVGRQWEEGINILQDLASSGKLAPVVVFALGTNGATDDAGVDRVMSLAGNSKVVFMTIYGTTEAAKANYGRQNAVVKRALDRYPGRTSIADWYSVAAPHPEWFEGDPLGVHPVTPEAQQAFAQVLAVAAGSSGANNFSIPLGTNGSIKSNVVCVKVGSPATDKPAICNQPPPNAGVVTPGGPRPDAPAPGGELQVEIQRQFGISMIGFDQQHLQWAWEKFWQVSGTNFNSLVKGAIIQTTSVSNTQQVGCPPNTTALIGQFPEETAFKHILMHELGHAIRNCSGREKAQESAFIQANKSEGGVSYYAKNAPACTGSDNISEDYAEMIAFYLNNDTPVASYLRCYQQQQFRLSPQQYPLHYKVAQDVLGPF